MALLIISMINNLFSIELLWYGFFISIFSLIVNFIADCFIYESDTAAFRRNIRWFYLTKHFVLLLGIYLITVYVMRMQMKHLCDVSCTEGTTLHSESIIDKRILAAIDIAIIIQTFILFVDGVLGGEVLEYFRIIVNALDVGLWISTLVLVLLHAYSVVNKNQWISIDCYCS